MLLYLGAALLIGGLTARHAVTPGFPRLRWPLLGLLLLFAGAALKTYGVLAELEMLDLTDTLDFLTRVPAGRSTLYLLMGACLLLAAHVSRFSRLTELGAAALTLWGLAGLGHGATHGDTVRFAHVIHAGAMSIWVAGVGALLTVRPLPVGAVVTFSKVATACVALLAASGVYMTVNHAGGLVNLPASVYGQRLLLKVGLFIVILTLAFFVRRQALRGGRLSGTLSRVLLSEAALLVLVLGLTATLATLPPPAHS